MTWDVLKGLAVPTVIKMQLATFINPTIKENNSSEDAVTSENLSI